MNQAYDVIVLGVGGMGSSACHSLAKEGVKVLGLEQYSIAHDRGSSHGELRMIRQAYFEHPDYVPLLKKAYGFWKELGHESGENLFHQVGLLIMSSKKDSKILDGIKLSSKLHSIAIEEWNSREIRQKFPQFQLPDGFIGVFEPGAGYLLIEKCIQAFCHLAKKKGAHLKFHQQVVNWSSNPQGVTLKTKTETYHGKKLIITAGPWTSQILNDLNVPLQVRRAPQFWWKGFEKSPQFPCFAFEVPQGFFYGFPQINGMIKMASHEPREKISSPEDLSREITQEDYQLLSQCVGNYLAPIKITPKKSSVCMYTMTPDENFIIDQHPNFENVFFAAGFSGHGYKFSSVIGPILADLALRGSTDEPIDFLRLRWH